MKGENETINEARNNILLTAMDLGFVNEIKIKTICASSKASADAVMRRVCPYIEIIDNTGGVKQYRLTYEGKIFISGGFWDRVEADKEKHALEIKTLKNSIRNDRPAFWMAIIAIGVSALTLFAPIIKCFFCR